MALPTFRYPSAPAKSDVNQTEPDENQKKAAMKRRTAVMKPQPEDDKVVDQRKKAGY